MICLTGVIEVLSFGALAIANAAHVGGLVAGCLTGVIGGTLARARAVALSLKRDSPVEWPLVSGAGHVDLYPNRRKHHPEIYASLKQALELGKWADGRKLTPSRRKPACRR